MKSIEIRALILKDQKVTEEIGLTDDEKVYLRGELRKENKYMTLGRKVIVDERELLEKWRRNIKKGREETEEFTDDEINYWSLYGNRVRLQAINNLERERARREVNRIRLKLESSIEDEKEKKKFWREEVMKKGRTTFGELTDREKGLLARWVEHPGRVHFDVERDAEPFNEYQKASFRLLREGLFVHGNWGVMRRVFNLDYPWLDLQHRYFLSKAIDWAALRKIGFFGKENKATGEITYPLDKELHEIELPVEVSGWLGRLARTRYCLGKRNPDAVIKLLRLVLDEKIGNEERGVYPMHFRYGLKIEHMGVLEPTPVVPIWDFERWENGELMGDPAIGWELGDRSYSHAWMKHRRWDAPDTLAIHNIVMMTLYNRLYTCPEFLLARGEKLARTHIMRLVPTSWDLFKTREMEPGWFFGGILGRNGLVSITKNEEGYYATLENMGVLSSSIAEYLRKAEGVRLVRPESYRSWMARLAIMDTITKRVGGEELVEAVRTGVLARIPGLGPLLEKIPTITVPRGGAELFAIGGTIGLGAGVTNFLFLTTTGAGGMIVSPIGWGLAGGLAAAGGFWLKGEDWRKKLCHDGILYDCVLDPTEMAKNVVESMSKRLRGGE